MSRLSFLFHRHFWVFYVLWIGFCAALFFALQPAEEESSPRRRLPSATVGAMALEAVQRQDPRRWNDYEVVNVAWSREGEAGPEERWIVLLDRWPRSGLENAIVVELEPDGTLIRVRDVPH